MPALFLLFVITPVLELWLLIAVGKQLGATITILLVLLTALTGVALLRRQGLLMWQRVRMKLTAGEMPGREMIDGLFLVVSGVLLLTPGFITDVMGLLCLVTGIRTLLIRLPFRYLNRKPFRSDGDAASRTTTEGHVLEGDFERENK